MRRLLFLIFLTVSINGKSNNDKLTRFFNNQLYDIYIEHYNNNLNEYNNDKLYTNNFYISIIKSERSKNYKHQYRTEIENFIDTNLSGYTNDLIYAYGVYEYSNNRFKNAIKFLSKNKSKDSDYYIGLSYYHIKDYIKAEKILSNSKKSNDNLNFVLGAVYYNLDQFEKSLDYLNKVDDENYKSKKLPFLISIYFINEDYEKVLDYESSVDDDTENLDYCLFFIGKSNLITNNYDKSITNFLNIKSEIDRGDEIKYLLAYSYYQNNNLDEAKNLFNQILNSKNKYIQKASYYLASIFYKEDNFNIAKNYFYAAYRENQEDLFTSNSLLNYSKCLYEIGNYDLSITTLNKLKSEFPNYKADEVNNLISENYFLTNDYRRIINYLSNQKEISSDEKEKFQFITYQRGVNEFNKGEFKNAINYFNLSNRYKYNIHIYSKAIFNKSEAYFVTNQYSKSKSELLNLLNIRNLDREIKSKAFKSMGYTLFNMIDYENSAVYFENYLKSKKINSTENINNEDLDVFIRLADSYYASKNYRKALNVYNKIINSNYSDKNYLTYQVALCYYGLSEFGKSFEYLDRVINNSNKSLTDDALFRKAQIYFETSEFDKSIEYYSEIIENIKYSKYIPYSYLNRATSYFNLKSYDQAEKDFLFILNKINSKDIQAEALLGMQKIVSFTNNFTLLNKQISNFRSNFPDSDNIQNIEYENIRNLYFNQKYNDLVNQVNSLDSSGNLIINRNEIDYYLAESYYKTNNYKNAEKIYVNISDSINSKYFSRSLNRLASINLRLKNYEKSINYYKNLQNITKNNRERVESFIGILSNYFYLKKYDSVFYYSNRVNDFEKISFNNRNKINLISAKSFLENNNTSSAIDMLLSTINLVKDESAAEANLILAQIFYNNGQNNQALETLYSLNENFQGYPYWVGKSYILIAEIFLSDDDKFQAEATLSSIIENTSVEEVKTEALSILKKINLDDEPL